MDGQLDDPSRLFGGLAPIHGVLLDSMVVFGCTCVLRLTACPEWRGSPIASPFSCGAKREARTAGCFAMRYCAPHRSEMGHELPRRALSRAAARPPITDREAQGWRGRDGPAADSCAATKSGRFRNCLSGVQLVEQSLGLLQIERVEAFGEPAVDRSEEIVGLLPLALIAPEPRHAHRRAQFP